LRRKSTNIRDARSGFTLIEVLFAVTILVTGLLPIIALQTSSLNRIAKNKHEYQASLIANILLVSIESGNWNRSSWKSTRPADNMIQQVTRNTIGTAYDYPNPKEIEQYTVTLEAVPWEFQGIPKGFITRINVTVFWSESPRDRVKASLLVTL